MKRISLYILIIVSLLFTLSACGQNNSSHKVDFVTLSQAKAGSVGEIYKVKGVVIATSKDMFLIQDDSDTMVVYMGKNNVTDLAIGDEVEVQGPTKEYCKTIEFGEGTNYTKVGTKTVTYPQARELNGEDLDSLNESTPKTEFIKIVGILRVGYYGHFNLEVNGATVMGGLYTMTDISEYADKLITVSGYYLFNNSGYASILVTNVEECNEYATVTFDSQGGGDVPSQQVRKGYYLEDPDYQLTKENYDFAGWYNGSEKWDFSVNAVYEDITLKAKWDYFLSYKVINDDEVVVTGVNKEKKGITNLVIPEYIDGKKVTIIGSWAFSGCTSLTSITIGNSVTSIGDQAFYDCTSLTSITIGNSVTSIGDSAFYNCPIEEATIPAIACSSINNHALHKVTITSGTSIGDQAFYDCWSLTIITIPDSVTSIGEQAFNNCTSLTSITISDSVTSIGNSAFLYCSSLTSITIPDSVTSIGNSAFEWCTSLTSITIGNSVTSIGNFAFRDCTSLTSITIGNSVKSIGDSAFCDCTSLTSITLPNSLTSIGNSVFNNCKLLGSITIPDSVTSIGDGVFYSCTIGEATIPAIACSSINNHALHKVTITSGTSIGEWAFQDCQTLISITIPDSVTSIGKGAFVRCPSLKSITIPDSVTSIGDSAFCDCTSLTSITIGNSVTSIGSDAFYNCYSLTSIVIPKSVTSIGKWAFENCWSMSIYCEVESKPNDWDDDWNPNNRPVVWGYSDLSINNKQEYDGECAVMNNADGEEFLAKYGFAKYVCPECGKTIYKDKEGNELVVAKLELANDNTIITGCTNVDTAELLIVPDTVTSMDPDDVFVFSETLKYVYLPNTAYLYNKFIRLQGCNIIKLVIPEKAAVNFFSGSVTTIIWEEGVTLVDLYNIYDGYTGRCLRRCEIENIVLPISLVEIKENVFQVAKVTNVFYMGTSEQWDAINFNYNNTPLTDANRYYYSELAPTESGNYWHYVDGEPVAWN